MTTWPVHIQHWQHECCGKPFGVGDAVAWTLLLTGDPAGGWGWPDEMHVEVRAIAHRSGSASAGSVEIIGTADGFDIAVDERAARDGDTYRGVLIEEHHGGVPNKLAKVHGTVRKLWVLTQRFRREGRMWRPIRGEVRLAEVERMPHVFELDHEGSDGWSEIGALAQLELGQPDSPSPGTP